MEKVKKFIITTYDKDIYVLHGYESVAEIRERMAGLEWVTMPNGSEIRPASISKIQELADYHFQAKQKSRHKIGQYLAGESLERWSDHNGYITDSGIHAITGIIKNMPALSTGNKLTDRKQKG